VFRILKSTKFDFMGVSKSMLILSTALIVLSCVALLVMGLNMGVEFTGGTEIQLKYAGTPDLSDIRNTLKSIGMPNSVVTTIGDVEDNEVYIRLGVTAGEATGDSTDETTTRVVTELLGGEFKLDRDLNIMGTVPLAKLLAGSPELTSAEATAIAEAVLAVRKEQAIFTSLQSIADLPGVTPAVMSYLESEQVSTGPLSIRSESYIGPTIGKELKRKAGMAIFGSLLGMLVYIWIRFELQWGFAAVVALFHDTIITLGLVAIFHKELTLPVVAAFLTLIGYSVNDTVVVFDRIRENLRKQSGSLEDVVNLSINQTLSRTIITSGLTLVVTLSLFLFGGAALNPFAFVLTMGVIVGTYSSVFVASPVVVLLKRTQERRLERLANEASGATRRVKKA
jgi:preprotein translocase subunit SecF